MFWDNYFIVRFNLLAVRSGATVPLLRFTKKKAERKKLLRWIRSQTNITLSRGKFSFFKAGGKALLSLLITETGNDHALLARVPIGRGGDLVVGSQLKRFDDTDYLVKVSASRGRVKD